MLKIMNLKMIERTFPPLNTWRVYTQKISIKLQAECNFTHRTNYELEKGMHKTAKIIDFERAVQIRDQLKKFREMV